MTVAVAALCGVAIWTAVAFPVALVIGRAIHAADPGEDAPDGTAGDLLADQPPEVLTVDEAFRRGSPTRSRRSGTRDSGGG